MINIQHVAVIIMISTTGVIIYIANMCCNRLLNGDEPETVSNRINEINALNNSDTDSEYE